MRLGAHPRRRIALLGAIMLLGGAALAAARRGEAPPSVAASADAAPPDAPLPQTLAATGLYTDLTSRTIAPANRPFTPQYPLWTDGATKRRWIQLPPDATIDASTDEAWRLPVGTKLWKEFSFGRPFETRFAERTTSGWRFAAYVWSEDGTTATLAPEGGIAVGEIAPGVRHHVPSRRDCLVCHGGNATPVLGFSALQLSPDRDPNAAHAETPEPGAIDLVGLVRDGRLRGYTGEPAPRLPARTPTERAALGYLHANCGTCHRGDGALASLGMILVGSSGRASAVETTVDRPSTVAPARLRIARRDPDQSLLLDRMRSRSPASQMPPLGTQLVDEQGVALLTAWIAELPN